MNRHVTQKNTLRITVIWSYFYSLLTSSLNNFFENCHMRKYRVRIFCCVFMAFVFDVGAQVGPHNTILEADLSTAQTGSPAAQYSLGLKYWNRSTLKSSATKEQDLVESFEWKVEKRRCF